MGLFDSFWHRFLRRPYRLEYLDTGIGPQTVVLLHGLAANKEIWTDLVRYLPRSEWRIIAPDLVGFGASPKPQWIEYTVNEHARTVETLLKRLGVKGPVVVLGHSMGCLVAAHVAAVRPKLVGRVILYEPPLLGEVPEFPAHGKRSARYKTLFGYIAAHPQLAQVESRLLWRIARKLSGMNIAPQEWIPFERSLRNTILEQQAYEELKTIAVRTDIVYGRFDLVVIRRGIKEMFRPNPYVRLHLVSDMHGISARSARYLAGLLTGRRIQPKKRRRKSAGNKKSP